MDINELLAEFDGEAAITRKFLERVPADRLDWRPHEKSNTMGQLALHVASIPSGITKLAEQDSSPVPDFSRAFPQPASLAEILAAHEQAVTDAHERLPKMAGSLQNTWSATMAGVPVMSMPRSIVLRSFLMNHWIQHRGQLSVYLRLLGAKVPSSYGPSADESPFG